MLEYKKLFLLITKDNKTQQAISDLVYIQNEPHVVLKWCLGPDSDIVPEVAVALDPLKLHQTKIEEAEYIYELPIVWPDK